VLSQSIKTESSSTFPIIGLPEVEFKIRALAD
jgi:hypothetical protein